MYKQAMSPRNTLFHYYYSQPLVVIIVFVSEYTSVHSKTSVIEEKSQALHKQILELSENKTKAAQERVNKATKELETNKAKINKLNVAIKSNSRSHLPLFYHVMHKKLFFLVTIFAYTVRPLLSNLVLNLDLG